MADQSAKPSLLNQNTLVPIGVALIITMGAITGAWTIGQATTKLEGRLESLQVSVGQNTLALQGLAERIDTSWSRDDQAEFWEVFQAMNPTMEVNLPPIRRRPR